MLQTIKVRLNLAIALFTLLLLGLALFLVLNIYLPRYERAEGLKHVDTLSDLIIEAAGQQAAERGITAGGLALVSKKKRPQPQLLQQLAPHRQAGDLAMQRALEQARLLANESWIPASFDAELARTESAWLTFQQARREADQLIRQGSGSLSSERWVTLSGGLIQAAARLRQSALLPTSNAELATYSNQVIKQAAWMVAEYAGRERDLIAETIGTYAPMTEETLQQLMGYRAIVETQLDLLEHFLDVVDPAVLAKTGYRDNWQAVEQVFLGSYESLRQEVYDASYSGIYPVEVGPWLQRSTAAIDVLLTVGEAASQVAIYAAERDANSSRSALMAGVAIIVAVLVLATGLMLLVRGIIRRLDLLKAEIASIERDSDLTHRLPEDKQDELGEIGRALNSMFDRFHQNLLVLRDISSDVSAAAQQLATTASSGRTLMERQNREIISVASATTQMVDAVNEVARITVEGAELTERSEQHAAEGRTVVNQSLDSINTVAREVGSSGDFIQQLEQQTAEINDILNVISNIADQTNLLALNAAIEAARAGEHGRGFAVVADEVRQLAHNTQQSTGSIENMISALQASANQAVSTMQQSREQAERGVEQNTHASEALTTIADLMVQASERSTRIAAAADEQSSTTAEINSSVHRINQLAQQSVQGTEESEAASKSLRDLAERMSSMVSAFRL